MSSEMSSPPPTPYTWMESPIWDPKNPNLAYTSCLQTPFTPFSKCDQHLLSSSPPNATVNVEYTRATVDKSHGTGIKRYAYWDERPCSVVRSRWFFIEDGSGRPGKDNPQPLCEADDDAVEGIYMEGLTAEERELDWGGVGGYKATWGDGKEGEVRERRWER